MKQQQSFLLGKQALNGEWSGKQLHLLILKYGLKLILFKALLQKPSVNHVFSLQEAHHPNDFTLELIMTTCSAC